MTSFALHLVVTDVDEAASWYSNALGAHEIDRLTLPDGTTVIANLRLGGLELAIAAEMPQRGLRTPRRLEGTAAAFHLIVADADASFDRAVAAGASVFEPVHDAFWGDRTGQVLDPDGHRWAFDQPLRDVPAEELARQAARLFAGSDS